MQVLQIVSKAFKENPKKGRLHIDQTIV